MFAISLTKDVKLFLTCNCSLDMITSSFCIKPSATERTNLNKKRRGGGVGTIKVHTQLHKHKDL